MNRSALLLAALLTGLAATPALSSATPAERLSETGLYADIATKRIAPELFSFSPQYPLWTDGAKKRRWISLPPGTTIDASDPDAWVFPVGTKLWKEFAFARRVETRYLEHTTEGWVFATYHWLEDESDAILAGEYGERAVYEVAPGVAYDLPGRYDCRACHEGNVSRVLGFGALQLSSDRDPLAPHGADAPEGEIDLAELVARGLVRGLPETLVATPPRIPARSGVERAALGYLHGNCSSCHNDRGTLSDLGFSLEVRVGAAPAGSVASGALATAIDQVARFQPSGERPTVRLAAGRPDESTIVRRMSKRDPINQMPPLGTKIVDREAIALLEQWIRHELGSLRETSHASLEEEEK